MNNENVFYSKYIKYKQKYLLLKGGDKTCNCKKCKCNCKSCKDNNCTNCTMCNCKNCTC
jgi:hypothetical protein